MPYHYATEIDLCEVLITSYHSMFIPLPEALKSLYRSPGYKTRGSGEPVSLT